MLSYPKNDWSFLRLCDDWYSFFNKIRHTAQDFKFFSTSRGNVSPEDESFLEQFASQVQQIPYPNLSVTSNSGFGEKVNEIKYCLKTAYDLYDEAMNYFISKHDDGDMKQQDIESDWNDYDNQNTQDFEDMTQKADTAQWIRRNNPFRSNKKRTALSRYDIVANPNGPHNQEYHNSLMGWDG